MSLRFSFHLLRSSQPRKNENLNMYLQVVDSIVSYVMVRKDEGT